MYKDIKYYPEVFISKHDQPDRDGVLRNISIGIFKPSAIGNNGKPLGGYGTSLPQISYEEAKELYRALRKTLIQSKKCTNRN